MIVNVAAEEKEGHFAVSLFPSAKGFPSQRKKASASSYLKANEKTRFVFPELPCKEVAVAVLQDLNGNKKLDKNIFGMPTEPFGFSNNPEIYFAPPSYEEAAFVLQERTEVTVDLKGN